MRLMHNLESLNIYRQHVKNLTCQSKAMDRISSGNKINNAKDNPNDLASSERMRIQIRGLQMSQRNSQDGISMMQTFEGALGNATDMLQRIKELVEKAASPTNNPGDNKIISKEISSLVEGIDDIINNTEFNEIKLLNGNEKESIFTQIGANVGEKIDIPIKNILSENLKSANTSLKDLKDKGVNTPLGLSVTEARTLVDDAMDKVLQVRTKFGALTNRFESTYSKTVEIHDSIVGSSSKLKDADVACEMMDYTRDSILIDAGHAMMVQSNKFPQDVLKILENVRAR